MADIAGDLQRALFARLTSYAPLTAIIAQRVYDRTPPSATMPYVTIADAQVIEDGADCIEGDEVNFDIHVWSRPQNTGSTEAKAIAGLLRKALHHYDLPLGDDHATIDLAFTDARFLRDPDGLTAHGVVTFRLLSQSS